MKYRKMVRKLNYNGQISTKYNAKIVYDEVISLKDLADEVKHIRRDLHYANPTSIQL